MSTPTPSSLEAHIVLCGVGRLGHRVLRLLAQLGERVAVVTTETPCDWPPSGGEGFTLVIGDARDEKRLRQAGITCAKAIIITTNDDLTNVSIALDARRLNPGLSVVVRLFDQQLGAHLEKGGSVDRALSTSALAAPAFVGAALGDSLRGSFEVEDGFCVIENRGVAEGSPAIGKSAREWGIAEGEAILGLGRGGAWQMAEADAGPIQAGDVLVVVRSAARGLADALRPPAPLGRAKWRTLWLGLQEWWSNVPLALQAALGILLLVVLLSVALFRWQMHLPLVDAVYFVVTIITTVGFGDYNFQSATPALKLYGSVLMLCGATMLAVFIGLITDLLLSTRFRDVLARGCCRLQGHIIVVGLGNLGFRVLRELARSGETVVAVERDAGGKFVETARSLAPVVLGNARIEETLRKAGLAGAKAVLALTDDDITNLSIGLAVKRARPDLWAVLRVFDSGLADKLRGGLGVDVVLSVSAEAAATFVGAALGPGVLHGFMLGDYLVVIFRCAAGAAPAPAANNELRFPAGDIGARWYRLRPEA
jgi:Trk K+ transport system NAD-binding subunit